MRTRIAATLAAVTLAAAGCGSTDALESRARATAHAGLVGIGAGLEGPQGLRATVYASGLPTVSALAFDGQGRLWVATSAATSHANDGVYLVRAPHAKPVKVVAGLKGPLGLTWYRARLFVSSIGRVDAFWGLRGTRFSRHETILEGPVAGASNNELVQAPDGRLLLGVSTSCDHCRPSSKWSATIVSFRPDGTGLRVYASGVRAAFGLTFFPGTSDLLATMNQRDDLGARTPGDWLAVVREGQNWGFPDCYGQDGAACSGVPKPTAVLDRHAAAGGVAIVTGQLGAAVGTSALVTEWQAGKVLRVALRKSGAEYRSSVSPFLAGLQPEFRS